MKANMSKAEDIRIADLNNVVVWQTKKLLSRRLVKNLKREQVKNSVLGYAQASKIGEMVESKT